MNKKQKGAFYIFAIISLLMSFLILFGSTRYMLDAFKHHQFLIGGVNLLGSGISFCVLIYTIMNIVKLNTLPQNKIDQQQFVALFILAFSQLPNGHSKIIQGTIGIGELIIYLCWVIVMGLSIKRFIDLQK